MKNPITQERLRELLSYDQDTGLFTWRVNRNQMRAGMEAGANQNRGYRHIYVEGQYYLGHRLAWLYVYGALPTGQIDHRNRDRSDNRISNLRIASGSENNANSKRRKDNKSGFKGVSFHKDRGRWRAAIYRDGRQRHLGLFQTPDEAHAAYLVAAEKMFGEFARAA